jgi:FkbM family methyltransferase
MPSFSVTAKLAAARVVSSAVLASRRLAGRDAVLRVRRSGLLWELDLSEMIDFSIYMLGAWERHVQGAYRRCLAHGDVVLDIGANIGAHSLPIAQLVGPHGRIIAIEPTDLAFRKLRRNIELNPELSARMIPLQMAMLAGADGAVPERIYSSWPLRAPQEAHPVHGGCLQRTSGAVGSCVDSLVSSLSVPQVNFIKIDVDGAEPEVLLGARSTLQRWRPRILLEWSDHFHAHCGTQPDQALGLLGELEYRVISAGAGYGMLMSRDASAALGRGGKTWTALLESGPLR